MGSLEPSGEGVRGIVAFIGIGSNLRDPAVQCGDAIRRLGAVPEIRLLRRSSLYRTEPVGFRNQAWFVNAVAEIRTELRPRKLLDSLKGIEREMGRTEGSRWRPRVIDLDLLLYG
jgi:2-amino-4-hydroxy-6-hydroxymethyldihydropteridine diphosphokinase